MNWNLGHIKNLEDRGVKVKFTAPPSRDRSLEVVSNGKVETVKVRKQMEHEESELQQACVKIFRLMYPKLKKRLFAIPNGSYRTAIGAAILNAEGCTPGIPDVFLAVPRGSYGGCFIEFKTSRGRLSEYQAQFIDEVKLDYYCVVVKTVEEFLKEIKDYLGNQEITNRVC